MKIQEFFEKGYYINLDRRKDRYNYITNVLSEINLLEFCERVPGVDGIQEPDPIKKHHYCSASHQKVYNLAKEQNFNNIVVFEDDFTIFKDSTNNGLTNIENSLDQLKNIPDWDLIYFGGYIFDKEIKRISENLLKVDTILALHGYGISKSGMEKLSLQTPFEDCQLDGWIGQREYINKYVVYPFSTYQLENPSDLDASGNTPDMMHWKRSFITEEKVIV